MGKKKHRAEDDCRERLSMLSPPSTRQALLPERHWACGFAAHGCNNQQTWGSGGLIPVPAPGQDGIFFSPSLLRPQDLVLPRSGCLDAHLKEFSTGK